MKLENTNFGPQAAVISVGLKSAVICLITLSTQYAMCM